MHSLFLLLATILVSSQADFDRLPQDVQRELARKPAELKVEFRPGTYHFKDNHLLLNQKADCPQTRLVFEGNGARLVGTAPDITMTPFFRADRLVEVVDADKKLCRIRTKKRLQGHGRLYIQVSSWFRLYTGEVTEVKGRYLYFTVEKLERSGLNYNINGDFSYGKQRPRFRLVRVQDPAGPASTPVFNFTACNFRQVDISGFAFEKNAGLRMTNPDNFLIRFYSCRLGSASVHDCTFQSIRSDVVRIAYTEGVEIRNCVFKDCSRICVLSYNHSAGTRVVDNVFEQMGLDPEAEVTPCVKVEGSDYLVSGNRFVDYGCCAIMAGMHFTAEMKYPSSGLIERNEIYQTDAYRKEAPQNLLMDTGAIYVYTQNASVEIRNNDIHDIAGPCDNRGIFCDDGTVNAYIHDNKVARIENSYDIDLRRVLSVESRPDSKIRRVNVGNRVEKNQVDGKIRFEQR